MSPRSDPDALSRPDDHIDVAERPSDDAPVTQPKLGVVGWLRFAWRQLTSMRTALLLLLLLAIAAVPGSLVPQRSSDPNGVTQYFADNPDLAEPEISATVHAGTLAVLDLSQGSRLAAYAYRVGDL